MPNAVPRTVLVSELSPHPEAGRVPVMRGAELEAFLEDLRARGVRVPLEVLPGTNVILDGRCRWLAARTLGIDEVPVVDAPLASDEDPVLYMIRAASHRRHLTDDQRAMLAEEERQWLAEKGRHDRARAAGEAGGRGRPRPLSDSLAAGAAAKLSDGPSRDRSQDARETAARDHNVSERKVKLAKQVAEADPELAEKVRLGEMRLAEAVRKVREKDSPGDGPRPDAVPPTPAPSPTPAAPVDGVPRDQVGLPLSGPAAEAFLALPKFAEIEKLLRQAARLVNELAQTPGGEYYARQLGLESRDGKRHFHCADIHNAIRKVRYYRPHVGVCPSCRVQSPTRLGPDGRCRVCLGYAYIIKDAWDRIDEELRAGALASGGATRATA